MLLAMLEWRKVNDAWLDLTRYMEIERGPQKVNEYKERPVLPDPLAVVERWQGGTSARATRPSAPPAQREPAVQREPAAPVAPTPPRPSGPTLPAVGNVFTSKVLDADETAVLIAIPKFETAKAIGFVRATNLQGKRYQPGNPARVKVIKVTQDKNGRYLVELTPDV
jgi:hypothetical protein